MSTAMRMPGLSDIGVIVGRFQTPYLHDAHRDLIDFVLQQHAKVVVMIGCGAVPCTDRNPLDYHSRLQMVTEYSKSVICVPLPDMPSDALWSASVDRVLRTMFPKASCTLYGGRDSCISHYSGQHQFVDTRKMMVPLREHGVSATEIRKRIAKEPPINSSDFRSGAIWSVEQRFPITYSVVDVALIRHVPECCSAESPCDLEVLMGRKPVEKYPGRYRFIGGFVDKADASLEIAAARELAEESGLYTAGGASSFYYVGSRLMQDWRYRGTRDCVMSSLFYAVHLCGEPKAADDMAMLQWVPLRRCEEMALDLHKPMARLLLGHLVTGPENGQDTIHRWSELTE